MITYGKWALLREISNHKPILDWLFPYIYQVLIDPSCPRLIECPLEEEFSYLQWYSELLVVKTVNYETFSGNSTEASRPFWCEKRRFPFGTHPRPPSQNLLNGTDPVRRLVPNATEGTTPFKSQWRCWCLRTGEQLGQEARGNRKGRTHA